MLQVEVTLGRAGFNSPEKIANCAKAACHITAAGYYGSGSLVDGSCVGFPSTCILTNQHVIGTAEDARGASVAATHSRSRRRRWSRCAGWGSQRRRRARRWRPAAAASSRRSISVCYEREQIRTRMFH